MEPEPPSPDLQREATEAAPRVVSVVCPRCAKTGPAEAGRCIFCGAGYPGARIVPRVVRYNHVPESVHSGVSWLFWTFGLLLASNIGLSWYLGSAKEPDFSEAGVYRAAFAVTVVSILDSILVMFAWLSCRKQIRPAPEMGSKARLGWICALPLLAVMLLANIGYHSLLLSLAGLKPETDELMASGHYRTWLLVLICVQPAIVEELFFRRLAFDFFANATSAGTAAFASAMMFAAAHTGGFLSVPYLAFFGFCLAWLRWFTGSLLLPMILHGLHNLYICLDGAGFF